MSSSTNDEPSEPRWRPLARVVDSDRFQIAIGAVIVLNAIVLGLETYQSLNPSLGEFLVVLNDVFYAVFLMELITRILSYGTRPWNFFRHGWNVFDFIVIGGVLIPGLREQVTVIRLLRLARIVRLLRFLPDARVLIRTVTSAVPAVASMVVLTVLVLFVYGMVGVSLFGQELPQEWGNIGNAMLTLFVLLTLENFPQYLGDAQQVSPLATLYFLSYVLLGAFVIINLLIGIVIGSMERAREDEAATARSEGQVQQAAMLEHIAALRHALDRLEGEVDSMDTGSNARPSSATLRGRGGA